MSSVYFKSLPSDSHVHPGLRTTGEDLGSISDLLEQKFLEASSWQSVFAEHPKFFTRREFQIEYSLDTHNNPVQWATQMLSLLCR